MTQHNGDAPLQKVLLSLMQKQASVEYSYDATESGEYMWVKFSHIVITLTFGENKLWSDITVPTNLRMSSRKGPSNIGYYEIQVYSLFGTTQDVCNIRQIWADTESNRPEVCLFVGKEQVMSFKTIAFTRFDTEGSKKEPLEKASLIFYGYE